MASALLIATDNGFVVKHTSPSTDVLSFDAGGTHASGSNIGRQVEAVWNTPSKVLLDFEDQSTFVEKLYYSTDQGVTWTSLGPAPNGTGGEPIETHGEIQAIGLWGMEEDGTIWGVDLNTEDNWVKAAFGTLTFGDPFYTNRVTDTFDGPHGTWVGDGAIYGLCTKTGGTEVLYKVIIASSSGTTPDEHTMDVVDSNFDVRSAVTGRPGTNRLFMFKAAKDFLTIDTSSGFSYNAYADSAAFGGNSVLDIRPITNQIAIAHVTDFVSGMIYKSTDGGNTWAQVQAATANLFDSTGQNRSNSVVVDPSDDTNVYVASKPPYVYHSIDSGDTWTLETVDTSIFGAHVPTAWTALGVSKAPVFPSLTRYNGANQTPLWGPDLP